MVVTASQLVDAVDSDFPHHPLGARPVHSFGIAVTGWFQPSNVATRYSKAEQFTRRVPVTVRFSNGAGSAVEHDNATDARGMATKFHLSGGQHADLVMMTLPVFFVPTPKDFLEFAEASQPQVVRPQSWCRKFLDKLMLRSPPPPPDPGTNTSGFPGILQYSKTHPFTRLSIVFMALVTTPVSYARAKYHAVHTFKATNTEGVVRFVRLAWEPVAGVRPVDPHTAMGSAPDYLRTELRERLARNPARFLLQMRIAGQGEVLDDPTAIWDDTQTRVVMGELVLTGLVADQQTGCERLSFNPNRVVPGLECSNDPILAARGGAYEESCWRRGGLGCPA